MARDGGRGRKKGSSVNGERGRKRENEGRKKWEVGR